jgi:hypothetical protein
MPQVGVIEVATGAVDGTNRLFRVSASYAPGSVQVWLNGLLLKRDYDDGWAELGSNVIRLKVAPVSGDTVQVFYRPL